MMMVVLSVEIPNHWVNTHYTRTVDLKKCYIKESVLVEAKNIHDSPVNEYYFPLPDGYNAIDNVTVFSGVLEDKLVVDYEKVEDKLYKLTLPIPLAANSKFTLNIRYVYINEFLPIPNKIALKDIQALMMRLNKFNFNPYETEEYTLLIEGINKGQEIPLIHENFPENANLDVPKVKGVVEGKSLKFGPVYDVKPFSVEPMGLIFDHNRPLGKVLNLERDIWLPSSDINQFQIEEYYEITNVGAKLNSGFSRVDWLKGKYESIRNHWALTHLEFPRSDNVQYHDYYFTDKVGMVTTHKIIKNTLLFEPRFPLFGDWKYNFTFGYNQDFESNLRKLDDETYILRVPLLNSPLDFTYNNVNLNLYLPENAEFLNVSSPIEFNSISTGNSKSYLDVSKGHEKITINFDNLFDDLTNVDLYVTYKYTKANYWWKVTKISGFVFVGLISYYLLSLIDLSI